MAAPDLAIAIPVRNAPEDLSALLDEVAGTGLFSQVVIADDASDPPVDAAALGPGAARLADRIEVLRTPSQGGAGAARNRALGALTARDVLFFDADDRLGPDLAEIVALHAEADADFTIFRHDDTRQPGGRGSFPKDEALWDAATAAPGGPVLTRPAAAELARVAAYPWNKIYRTGFLRRHGVRCSETPVHNDILLHWSGFLAADRIAASPLVGARHVVRSAGAHLTRRTGEERLCLFDALDDVLSRLRTAPDRALFTGHFVQFAHSVVAWNLHMLRGEVRGAFAERARSWVLALEPAEFAAFAARRPEEAREFAGLAAGEDAA